MIKYRLRLALIFILWIFTACNLPTMMQADPPRIVLVTANPNAPATPTPFQPAGVVLAPTDMVLAATFTPLPPTDTPLPTLEYTATTLPSPTPPAASSRTQYTMYALLDYSGHQLASDETIHYTNQT